MLVAKRRGVIVQDELELVGRHNVTWGMTTDATIATDGATATLKLGRAALDSRILSPAGASFSVESAERGPPQKTNKGVSRLTIRMAGQSGLLRIAVLFSPAWPDGSAVNGATVLSLDQWGK